MEKLIQLADAHASAEATFVDPGEAEMFQYRVNNLLRSLALHFPSRAYVRNQIGTTVSMQGEKWLVTVGPIAQTRRGRKPKMFELTPREAEGMLTIAEEITPDTWPAVGLKLAVAKESQATRRITLLKPPDAKGIQFIADKLSPEFQLVSSSPAMVLERIAASSPPVQP